MDRGSRTSAPSPAVLVELFDRLADAIVVHRGGTILFANRAAAALTDDLDPEELVGRSVLDFVHPDSRTGAKAHIRAISMSATLHDSEQIDVTARGPLAVKLGGKGQQNRILEVTSVEVIDLEDGPAWVLFTRDVTEQTQLRRRLAAADGQSAMGTLAAAVVHEINNPLTFVLGNLNIASQQIETAVSSKPVRHALQRALADASAGAERVRKIVSDLRAFAQPDDDIARSLDLRRIVDSAVSLAWGELRHRARLVKDYGPVPAVFACETQLSQAFLILVLNATRAIDMGAAAQHQIRIRLGTDAEGWAEVIIRDTGRSFKDNEIAQLEEADALELGGRQPHLAACFAILRKARGTLLVDNEPGQGARFTVRLPPHAGTVEPATTGKEDVIESSSGGRILVVDDEPVIATLVRWALPGHEVYVATSGRDAVALCAGATFDVILCDLLMPELTGVSFYEQLKQVRPELIDRVVFMTAGVFTRGVSAFLRSVPNVVLYKPFELEDVDFAVRRVITACGPVSSTF